MLCSFAFKGASSEIYFCRNSSFSGTRSAACIVLYLCTTACYHPTKYLHHHHSPQCCRCCSQQYPDPGAEEASETTHPRNTYIQDGHFGGPGVRKDPRAPDYAVPNARRSLQPPERTAIYGDYSPFPTFSPSFPCSPHPTLPP